MIQPDKQPDQKHDVVAAVNSYWVHGPLCNGTGNVFEISGNVFQKENRAFSVTFV